MKTKPSLTTRPLPKGLEGTCFCDTNPAKVNPLKQQFAPTPQSAVRQRFTLGELLPASFGPGHLTLG